MIVGLLLKLEIRFMERSICPNVPLALRLAIYYFSLKDVQVMTLTFRATRNYPPQ